MADDAGWRDARMVEAAKRDTPNSETPITEAVRRGLAKGVIHWSIQAAERDDDDVYDVLIDAKGSTTTPGREGAARLRRWGEDFFAWQDVTAKDAASALRLVADALSPDLERRALEIAAATLFNLGKCPLSGHPNSTCPNPIDRREKSDCVRCWIAYWLQQAREFFEQAEGDARDE